MELENDHKKTIRPKRFISAHDVAKLAGVSRSAVSRAFTDGASVAPSTREKIMHAAERLGYKVNDLARGLLTNRSHIIGMIAADSSSPFRATQIASLSKALVEHGKVPVLIPTGKKGENLNDQHETLLRYRAEAIVILSGTPTSSFVDLAKRNGQTVIAIGRNEEGLNHIHINNQRAMEQAVLLFKQAGYKSLSLVTSITNSLNLLEREQAFIQISKQQGMSVSITRVASTDYEGGYAAGQQIFNAKIKPEGVFCVNDLMAFGCMDSARNIFNLRIPDDVSFIGFDDVPQASWHSYQLTTFRQDTDLLASHIIMLIEKKLIDQETEGTKIILETPLIVRNSVKTTLKDIAL